MAKEPLTEYLRAWRQSPTLPLQVSRARYDDPFPQSWEVLHYETPTCSVPIAEFTEWGEAQAWAVKNARWAAARGVEVRRYKYGYWPSGNWGGIGYFDHAGEYHELPDPDEVAIGPLDPKPWLFISDQVFGEFRSDHDRGYHDVSGAWWQFRPRPEYEQDRARYESTAQGHADGSAT